MDPKQTLTELRQLAREIENRIHVHGGVTGLMDRLEDFQEKFQALDAWMARGGFSPWENVNQEAAA